ncbi:MAG TPA: thioredoxin family protein [Candidatus Gastranaerophilales bacterium]|nr:thioredoxin family protein [Candidatus Gastranaerophilales bacterium]
MKKIQILGTGCPKCEKLAEAAEKAAKELGIEFEIEKVKDITEIMNFGVMMTPALAVDGKVKISGKVPSVDEIKGYLSANEECCSDKNSCDINCAPNKNSCDCGGCC